MELCSSLKSVRLRKWDRPHFGLHMGQVAPHHQRVRLGLARKALGIVLRTYTRGRARQLRAVNLRIRRSLLKRVQNKRNQSTLIQSVSFGCICVLRWSEALLSYSLWHPKRPSQRLVCRPAVVRCSMGWPGRDKPKHVAISGHVSMILDASVRW